MSFGSGGEHGPRSTGSFDFGLVPSSQIARADGTAAPHRNRRRRSGPDRSVLLTVALVTVLSIAVIGGAGATAWYFVQSSEAEVKAASAPFCADLGSTPGVLAQPGFGWPTDPADLPTTIAAMTAYQQRWNSLAQIGPPTIKADISAVATAAGTIVANVEASQSINRAGNLATIQAVTSQTSIPAWSAKYCD